MNLPDCKTYLMPQRSEAWLAIRKGIFTASNFGPWLLNTGKVADAARERSICALIAERAGCESAPVFENWAMKRGSELEPQAIASFEGETGLRVEPVGFCRSLHGRFGCSPDGILTGKSCGIEGKIPVPETHIRYRRAGVLPDEYIYQVHGSMAVTGADSWWFQSWNPGLAPLRILVHRDEFTEKLKSALIEFSEQFEAAWAEECKANGKEAKGEA